MTGNFVCNMCGKQFKSHKMLTQHNRDVHIEGDFPCTLCDKTSRTKKHLANHVFIKHKEKESMQCNSKSDDIQCTYETTSVSNLNKHKKRVHEKIATPPNFAYSSCDFKTASKFSLKRHNVSCKKSVELLPHEISCTQCRKTFSTQKALSRHTKSTAKTSQIFQTLLHVWSVRKHLQNLTISKGINRLHMGSRKKAMLYKTVWVWLFLQQRH